MTAAPGTTGTFFTDYAAAAGGNTGMTIATATRAGQPAGLQLIHTQHPFAGEHRRTHEGGAPAPPSALSGGRGPAPGSDPDARAPSTASAARGR